MSAHLGDPDDLNLRRGTPLVRVVGLAVRHETAVDVLLEPLAPGVRGCQELPVVGLLGRQDAILQREDPLGHAPQALRAAAVDQRGVGRRRLEASCPSKSHKKKNDL